MCIHVNTANGFKSLLIDSLIRAHPHNFCEQIPLFVTQRKQDCNDFIKISEVFNFHYFSNHTNSTAQVIFSFLFNLLKPAYYSASHTRVYTSNTFLLLSNAFSSQPPPQEYNLRLTDSSSTCLVPSGDHGTPQLLISCGSSFTNATARSPVPPSISIHTSSSGKGFAALPYLSFTQYTL